MELKNIHNVYFVGIGGIGMSALAQWFYEAGFKVAGYDKTPSDITNNLIDLGISVSFSDTEQAIPDEFKSDIDTILVVYTPAIPSTHAGLRYFFRNKYQVVKRSEALGMLVKDKNSIAVAGTHGKTSVSSTLAYILSSTKLSCSAFLGGVVKKLKANVVINPESDLVVVEADEFDRSFLTLYPQIAIITAIDADHLDIYKNKEQIIEAFEQFVAQVKPGGKVIIKKGVEFNKEANNKVSYYSYSISGKADFYTSNIHIQDGEYHFNLITPFGSIENLSLGVPGLYNLENAVAALAAAILSGADTNELLYALQSYNGVKRRFDVQINSKQVVYIDDYAHHPAEIEACISSVRHLYPGKTITGIFQPHLYTRTRDFYEEFAKSLDALDQAIILPIYPARELPIEGITSKIIGNKMTLNNTRLLDYTDVLNGVDASNTDVYITMGAGDIDRLVEPIKKKLIEKYEVNE